MKSTYSVIVVISLGWKAGVYEVHATYPAMPDQDCLDEAIEFLECLEQMPDREEIEHKLTLDDEPAIRMKRLYTMSVTDYGKAVHSAFDDDDEAMFEDAQSSVQQSFCRNCGAEGPSLEPDGTNGWCDSCGQNACQSTAVCIGLI